MVFIVNLSTRCWKSTERCTGLTSHLVTTMFCVSKGLVSNMVKGLRLKDFRVFLLRWMANSRAFRYYESGCNLWWSALQKYVIRSVHGWFTDFFADIMSTGYLTTSSGGTYFCNIWFSRLLIRNKIVLTFLGGQMRSLELPKELYICYLDHHVLDAYSDQNISRIVKAAKNFASNTSKCCPF